MSLLFLDWPHTRRLSSAVNRASIIVLCSVLVVVLGCSNTDELSEDWSKWTEDFDVYALTLGAGKAPLRLEANKPGTAFCLAGKPLVAGDPGLTIQAGDRVYVLDPPPEGEEVTVVAAQSGYFVFVDSTTPDKRFLQFQFFERNRCKKSSQGRTCAQADVVSDLAAFERFCSSFP